MTLTPQMIAAMNKATGNNVPVNGMPPVQSRADEIRALAKQAGQKEQPPEKKPTFVGGIIRDVARPVVRTAMSLQNLGEEITGQPVTEEAPKNAFTDYLSEGDRGPITRIGKDFDPAQGFTKQNITAIKDSAGTGAELVSNVIGGGAAKNVAQAGFKGLLKQAIKQGIKEGAIAGGTAGLGTSLEDDDDLSETLTNTALGSLTGAVVGSATAGASKLAGAGVNKIKSALANRGTKAAEKSINKALDSITPNTKDLTPTEYENLLRQKRITPKTAKEPSKYVLSEGEKNIATKYKDILQGSDPVVNSNNLLDEISKQDEEVGSFLKNNNGIYNTGELKNNLREKLSDITDITVDENRLNNLKETLIENFSKSLKKNDMESLWLARKEFDKKIESAFSGSPNLQKDMKKALRDAVQDFISERTPEGVYKTYMKEMSQLFNLQDTVATKANKEKGKNALQVWIKNNPTKARALGWGSALLGSSQVYQSLKD